MIAQCRAGWAFVRNRRWGRCRPFHGAGNEQGRRRAHWRPQSESALFPWFRAELVAPDRCVHPCGIVIFRSLTRHSAGFSRWSIALMASMPVCDGAGQGVYGFRGMRGHTTARTNRVSGADFASCAMIPPHRMRNRPFWESCDWAEADQAAGKSRKGPETPDFPLTRYGAGYR